MSAGARANRQVKTGLKKFALSSNYSLIKVVVIENDPSEAGETVDVLDSFPPVKLRRNVNRAGEAVRRTWMRMQVLIPSRRSV